MVMSQRCFKCGSTNYMVADCPEASTDDRMRKGKKIKFAALVAKFSIDILEDPSSLPCARLNDCKEVDTFWILDPISR